jgi:hydrogenase/urease accessory protein HupE
VTPPSQPPLAARRARPARWSLLCLSLWLAATPALAHVGGSVGLATVTVSGQTIRYDVQLSTSALPVPLAEALRLGDPALAPDYAPLLGAVASHVHVRSQEQPCEPVPASVTPARSDGGEVDVLVHFACAQAPGVLSIRDDLFDVLGADHHTIANIEYPGGTRQFVFQPDARELRVSVSAADTGGWGGSFFTLGVEHILTGYDHLLFLLALILAGGNLLSLLKIVTAFTIAHSITLALAVLGVVVVPERLVEATIAASIAYVAAENLFARRPTSHRWAVSFLFGLVHGFGFSAVLRQLGLPEHGLAWSLLAFNLGVEAGQACAVVLALPLLLWARRFRWEPRLVAIASAVILGVGVVLVVERGLLA